MKLNIGLVNGETITVVVDYEFWDRLLRGLNNEVEFVGVQDQFVVRVSEIAFVEKIND